MSSERERVGVLAHLLWVLPGLLILVLLNTGCRCKAICDQHWIGPGPPAIYGPEDIRDNLKQEANDEIGFFGEMAGLLSTPIKRLGIFGWKDLGYDGEITGTVLQATLSNDQFYTVDMKLQTLRVGGIEVPLLDERYLRAEICFCDVELSDDERPHEGETVWMSGRLMWDGDGFIEIHPRNEMEVKRGTKVD